MMPHIEVKKLGNIPDGGSWRYGGRKREEPSPPPDKARNKYSDPLIGKAYVRTVIDDHSRVAYAEIHDDENALTTTGVVVRAIQWFNAHGVAAERVLSHNGGTCHSHL